VQVGITSCFFSGSLSI